MEWNLENIYKNPKEIQYDIDKIRFFLKFIKSQEYVKETNKIFKIIKEIEKNYELIDRIYGYYALSFFKKMTIENEEKKNDALELYSLMANETQSFLKFLSDNNELVVSLPEKYRDFVYEQIKQLNEVTSFGDDLENIYNKYLKLSNGFICKLKSNNSDLFSDNLLSFLCSENRKIRKETYIRTLEWLKQNKTEAAKLIKSYHFIENEKIEKEEINGFYKNIMSRGVSIEEYNKSVEILYKNRHLVQKFLKNKAKSLNLRKISNYDLYIDPYKRTDISISEAKKIIFESLKPLGLKYKKMLEYIFDNDLIDWLPHENKRIGGLSWNIFLQGPYILINWKGDIDSLFMLTHEIGGAIASQIYARERNFFLSEIPESIVEIYSIVNEKLLIEYLRKNMNSDQIEYYISNRIRENVVDTLLLLEFEKDLSNLEIIKELDSETISIIYQKTYRFYEELDDFDKIKNNKYNWIKSYHHLLRCYNIEYIKAETITYELANDLINKNLNPEEYIDFLKNNTNELDKICIENNKSLANKINEILNNFLVGMNS